MLAFQRHQRGLVGRSALFHIAAAQHGGDAGGDFVVVGGDEATVAQVDQLRADGGDAVASEHRESLARHRRTIARVEHRPRLAHGHMQQFMGMHDDGVAGQQIAQIAAFQRRLAYRGHGRSLEARLEEMQNVTALRLLCSTSRQIGKAAAARNQAHAHFHQAHIALEMHHAFGAVHAQLGASAQGDAADCGHHGHLGVAQGEHQIL